MQREIKFRAWDKENEEMLPNVVPIEDRCWIDIGMVGEHGELENEHVIMQFTGVKDSNGKDIYFGDVIDAIAEDEHKDQNGKKFVVWSKDLGVALADELDHDFGLSPAWTGWADLRVRGNIYENPALLSNPQ
jgi:uncharacterized phage protein (TIGR01671 family)